MYPEKKVIENSRVLEGLFRFALIGVYLSTNICVLKKKLVWGTPKHSQIHVENLSEVFLLECRCLHSTCVYVSFKVLGIFEIINLIHARERLFSLSLWKSKMVLDCNELSHWTRGFFYTMILVFNQTFFHHRNFAIAK